jgi:hypothetical protein
MKVFELDLCKGPTCEVAFALEQRLQLQTINLDLGTQRLRCFCGRWLCLCSAWVQGYVAVVKVAMTVPVFREDAFTTLMQNVKAAVDSVTPDEDTDDESDDADDETDDDSEDDKAPQESKSSFNFLPIWHTYMNMNT